MNNVARSKLLSIENDYFNVAGLPNSVDYVCKQMDSNPLSTYTVMAGASTEIHAISRSFVMEPVFKTNDSKNMSNQDYCPARLTMVEMDPFIDC